MAAKRAAASAANPLPRAATLTAPALDGGELVVGGAVPPPVVGLVAGPVLEPEPEGEDDEEPVSFVGSCVPHFEPIVLVQFCWPDRLFSFVLMHSFWASWQINYSKRVPGQLLLFS